MTAMFLYLPVCRFALMIFMCHDEYKTALKGVESGDFRHLNADSLHSNADSCHLNADSRHSNADSRDSCHSNAISTPFQRHFNAILTPLTLIRSRLLHGTRCFLLLCCPLLFYRHHHMAPVSGHHEHGLYIYAAV